MLRYFCTGPKCWTTINYVTKKARKCATKCHKKIPNSRMSNLFVSLHQLHSKAPSSWASVMLWETSARNQTEMFSCRTFLWWRASSCQGTLTFALQSFQRMTNAHAQGSPPPIYLGCFLCMLGLLWNVREFNFITTYQGTECIFGRFE